MTLTATPNRKLLGFRDGDKGTHSSRTLMLAELTTLLAAAPPDATRSRLRELVVEDNLLAKRSAGNRLSTFKHLSELFALDVAVPLYRVMRRLWDEDAEGRPLLALLCAVARDPLLRRSVDVVLDTAHGTGLTSDKLAATVGRPLAPTTLASIGRNLASSWTQAGFLSGVATKTRTHPRATPGAAAYALLLGFMEGGRGSLLLTTPWTRLLDCPPEEVLNLVKQAARRGWVEYRAAGDVMDIRVEGFFTDAEKEWCDGQ
jgi:hypothetical protein